jgi:hypothetical protein
MICLTHIPKTGGTTFRHILINNYSWRHIDFPESKKKIIKPTNFPFNSFLIKQIKSMSGHWLRYSDDMKLLFPNNKFIVFLREPISRIISLFFHIQRYENPNIIFREWVAENYAGPILSNFQTRFIAGNQNIDVAKSILDNGYFFAGITDLFDKSILILKRMLENTIEVKYEIKRSSKKSRLEILDDYRNSKAIEKLHQYNELDFQLYDHVKHSMLSKYQKEYGHVTNDDVGEFRELNKKFSFNKAKIKTFKIAKYMFYENMFRIRS